MGKVIDLDEFRKKNAVDVKEKVLDDEYCQVQARNRWDMVTDLDVLKLKLELVSPYEIPQEDLDTLKKHGKAEKGISREVFVPGRMTLHQMHYMIQKLFGWQNSHLHHFELPENVFEKLTEGRVKEWAELCGVYFRFPEGDDFSDTYWDDDYEGSVDLKKWLKKKYCHGNRDSYSVGDCYLDNRRKVKEFERWVRHDKRAKQIFGGKAFSELIMDDLMQIPDIGMDATHLAERMEIAELMHVKGKRAKAEDLSQAKDDIRYLTEEFRRELKENISVKELEFYEQEAADLRGLRKNMQEISRYMRYGSEDDANDLAELKHDHYWSIKELETECHEYINDWNPDIVQVTDELIYLYDYGDGWEVRITCEEGYSYDWEEDDFDYDNADDAELFKYILMKSEEGTFYDSEGSKIPDDMVELFEKIQYLQEPVCVAADGLNVMDDVGGIGGYLEFLETIHGSDREEASRMRGWAKAMGWTGRKTKPENML